MSNFSKHIFTYILFVIFLFVPFNLANSQYNSASPVVVSKVKLESPSNNISLVGTVYPLKKSIISNPVSGIVEEVVVDEGDYVKAGQVLAKIDTRRRDIQLTELQNEKVEAETKFILAKKELERINELHNKGITSERELDSATSEKEVLKARVNVLKNQIDKLNYDIDVSKIIAPFNGYITKEFTEAGQWLMEGSDVVEIINIDKVEIKADLPEKYINLVQKDDEVQVIINSNNDSTIPAKIYSVIPEADMRARTFPVKVVLENEGHKIKSSSSAVINIKIGEKNPVKLVPKDSILDNEGSKIIYVIRENKAHPVPVQLIEWYDQDVHINGEVKVGENVVIRGNERLIPMQEVTIAE